MEKLNKKVFSRIGFSLVGIQITSLLLQIILILVLNTAFGGTKWLEDSSAAIMLVSFIPMYAAAFPVGIWGLKKLPTVKGETVTLSAGQLVKYALFCMPVMYVGNIIGTLLSGVLSGGQATNMVEELLTGQIGIEILFIVILAPFFEEYVFRKLLIDKTIRFGEKTAVIFSALMFGVFHGNLFQFFYTFGIGLIWGYIYVKTRKFSYVFCLHALFNFMGGILPSMLMNLLGEEGMKALETMDMAVLETMPFEIMVYGLYTLVLLLLVIAGAVLLLKNRREFVLEEKELEEENRITVKTVWLNPGMIIFSVMILATFIYALFS